MLRPLVWFHTAILAALGAVLLVAPLAVLAGFGILAPSLPVLSLTRVLAGVLVIAAVAGLPLPSLPHDARRSASWGLAGAYGVATVLFLIQETAIWNSVTGAVITALAAAFASGFAFVSMSQSRRSLAAA